MEKYIDVEKPLCDPCPKCNGAKAEAIVKYGSVFNTVICLFPINWLRINNLTMIANRCIDCGAVMSTYEPKDYNTCTPKVRCSALCGIIVFLLLMALVTALLLDMFRVCFD